MKIPHKIKNTDLDSLLRMFGCFESIEYYFHIDLSCGDGLFLPDIDCDRELLDKYDGNVDTSLVRCRKTKKLMKGVFWFSFTYNDNHGYTGEPEFIKCKITNATEVIIPAQTRTTNKLSEAKKEIERLQKELAELKKDK